MYEKKIRILTVDDEEYIRELLHKYLTSIGYICETASSVSKAKELMKTKRFDLVLLDINMPEESGITFLKELVKYAPNTITIMASGDSNIDLALQLVREGAYDYIVKPFNLSLLKFIIERALKVREVTLENKKYQIELEKKIKERTYQLEVTQQAAIFGLAKLAEYRDFETGMHLERIRNYSVILAAGLIKNKAYQSYITKDYLEALYESSPLHDIGKVGIPDSILLKPTKLSKEEFNIMKTHTIIGGDALSKIEKKISSKIGGRSFLSLGKNIAYYHHEWYNGKGYPNGLKFEEIPLSARIVALSDFYDALTSKRVYRPYTFNHEEVCDLIEEKSGIQFDPDIVKSFKENINNILEIKKKYEERDNLRNEMNSERYNDITAEITLP